jgi:DNA-binding NtrC family response regulator
MNDLTTTRRRTVEAEVWVIDDEALVVQVTEAILREHWPELRVRSFTDSQEAWTALQERQPDVVITGSQMPGLSGEALVNGLRERKARCGILVYSGYEPAREWVRRHPGVRFLAKPFTPEQLAQAVEPLLPTSPP